MPAVITQAIFFRRRHQPRRPPLAKIKPGRPVPTMGAGTAAGATNAMSAAVLVLPTTPLAL